MDHMVVENRIVITSYYWDRVDGGMGKSSLLGTELQLNKAKQHWCFMSLWDVYRK
jgi:hypothetical protein